VDRVVSTRTGDRRFRGRVLKPGADLEGRPYVILARPGQKVNRKVHYLVLLAFVGEKPEGMEACHDDGKPPNNRLSNLRWDTSAANQADRIQHGTSNRGERNGTAKLTESEVREIRKVYAEGGVSYAKLGETYGVHKMTVAQIITRRTWTWLPN